MRSLLVFSLLWITSTLYATTSVITKKKMEEDLRFIHHVFEVKYAPLDWKGEFCGWNLDEQVECARHQLHQMKQPETKAFHKLLKKFFNSTRDYHVGIKFFSTEKAILPFIVKGAEGRYFIIDVNRDELPWVTFPFQVGDEIITFDGRPVDEVVQELRVAEFGYNTLETDQALAELLLTSRLGHLGCTVPRGQVSITGKRKGVHAPEKVTLEWGYTPERIQDAGRRPTLTAYTFSSNPSSFEPRQFLDKLMVFPYWDRSWSGPNLQATNRHALGARQSFIPPLGRKIWRSHSDDFFDAYIFVTDEGERVGYVRIAHYLGDEEEVEQFAKVIKLFETQTSALVIDQINNPGGSLFYLYGLASLLTDQPMHTPKHHLALTQEEVYTAHSFLEFLHGVDKVRQAKEVLGETFGGYPVTMETVHLMRRFCSFILDEWGDGNLRTSPTYLFGVDTIQPHPRGSYTKPILLLTNSLDFSGGDFFPAIMQDNCRATVLGTRTAGAGGYVTATSFPNHSGISGFHLTASIAERLNRKPLENLGVHPDISYSLTPDDLQNHYRGYVEAIQKAVAELLEREVE